MRPLLLALLLFGLLTKSYAQRLYPIDTLPATGDLEGRLETMYHQYIGEAYPAFDFITTTGKHLTSENCKGKVVFINCWFEYCRPCQAEFEGLNELYKKLSNDTSFVMIALARESAEHLPELLKKYGLEYPNVAAREDADKYNLRYGGYPTSIVIDKDGKIAYLTYGGPEDKEKATRKVMTRIYPVIQRELALVHSK